MKFQNLSCSLLLKKVLVIVSCFIFLFSGQRAKAHSIETLEEDNSIIIAINEFTYTIANQHDQFYSFIGVRAMSMVHLSIHDILNSRYRLFKPYLFVENIDNPIDVVAAAIESTRTILNTAYVDRKDTIDQVCDQWLSQRIVGKSKEQGVALGQRVANMFIVYRSNDGHEKDGDYTPMTKPGDYQHTPGFDWVWKPDFSVARPFTLDSISQFRSPSPPKLVSQTYADSYEEVRLQKQLGANC